MEPEAGEKKHRTLNTDSFVSTVKKLAVTTTKLRFRKQMDLLLLDTLDKMRTYTFSLKIHVHRIAYTALAYSC